MNIRDSQKMAPRSANAKASRRLVRNAGLRPGSTEQILKQVVPEAGVPFVIPCPPTAAVNAPHSKTLARMTVAPACAKRLGVRRPSVAFPCAVRSQTSENLHPRKSGAEATALQTLARVPDVSNFASSQNDSMGQFIELEQADGQTIFISRFSIIKFCEPGATPGGETISPPKP